MSVGAIEPQFYAELMTRLGFEDHGQQWDRSQWPAWKERVAAVFATRTRDEWCALLEGTETCFAPVLAPPEVAAHPHMAARGSVVTINGVPQPQAAPRFSGTPAAAQSRATSAPTPWVTSSPGGRDGTDRAAASSDRHGFATTAPPHGT